MTIYINNKRISEIFAFGRAISKIFSNGRLVYQKNKEKKYVTLTVIPSVEGAEIIFSYVSNDDYIIEGNTIQVLPGTNVQFYGDAGEEWDRNAYYMTVEEDTEYTLVLTKKALVTIMPTPSNAVVKMRHASEETWHETNSYWVHKNLTVYYEVSASGYVTAEGSVDPEDDVTVEVVLEPTIKNYTLTINPTPSNATITLKRLDTNTTVSGKTITVPSGTSVQYTVSASGYTTKTATVVVNSNQTVNVTLEVPTPSVYCYKAKWSTSDSEAKAMVDLCFSSTSPTTSEGIVYLQKSTANRGANARFASPWGTASGNYVSNIAGYNKLYGYSVTSMIGANGKLAYFAVAFYGSSLSNGVYTKLDVLMVGGNTSEEVYNKIVNKDGTWKTNCYTLTRIPSKDLYS